MTPRICTQTSPGAVRGRMVGARGALTFADAMRALGEPDVRRALCRALARAPYPAFFWECAPTGPGGDAPFEFVLVDSPALARISADPRPFANQLGGRGAHTFPNLGGQSLLVAPADIGPAGAHLARFVREGPPDVVDALWSAVPAAVERWFSSGAPRLWLSTSGLGVHWLHIRLDPSPKYYTWRPFRTSPIEGPTR